MALELVRLSLVEPDQFGRAMRFCGVSRRPWGRDRFSRSSIASLARIAAISSSVMRQVLPSPDWAGPASASRWRVNQHRREVSTLRATVDPRC
jgi:hypothetical protein